MTIMYFQIDMVILILSNATPMFRPIYTIKNTFIVNLFNNRSLSFLYVD